MAWSNKEKPRQVWLNVEYDGLPKRVEKTESSGDSTSGSDNGNFKVGDTVFYRGGTHFYSSYPGARGYNAKPGKARITQANGSGKAHPWHLIHVDNESNVYGWVDEGTFESISSEPQNSSGGSSGGSSSTFQYTVVSGDNLWNLAKKFLGAGNKYTEIYNANAESIENTARQYGKKDSSQNGTKGYWIYPGQVLTIATGQSEAEKPATKVRTNPVPDEEPQPDLANEITKRVSACNYTDVASGESDRITITMHDIGKQWLGPLFPKRGADLGVVINMLNWDEKKEATGEVKTFDCGKFILDDISFSGAPTTCNLKGVSIPTDDDFKSLPRSNTWEKTTVQQIASEIAGRAGVKLYYDADSITIDELEQSHETDSSFLYSLCAKYDLAMKVYNHKIVIYDIVKSEEKEAVATLKEKDLIRWTYNTTINGTYTGATITYTDPDTDETIDLTVGESGRMYSVNTQASSREDAEKQAWSALRSANRSIETLEITIKANTDIVASHTIKIEGMQKIDGKYYVDRISHSIGSGYTMALSLHKVQGGSGGNNGSDNNEEQEEKKTEYKVGDIVTFKGGTHFYSSYPGARGYSAKPGKAKITIANGSGKAHPWHLVHVDNESNVYGWVDDGTFE